MVSGTANDALCEHANENESEILKWEEMNEFDDRLVLVR